MHLSQSACNPTLYSTAADLFYLVSQQKCALCFIFPQFKGFIPILPANAIFYFSVKIELSANLSTNLILVHLENYSSTKCIIFSNIYTLQIHIPSTAYQKIKKYCFNSRLNFNSTKVENSSIEVWQKITYY